MNRRRGQGAMWYVIQTEIGKEEDICRKCGNAFPEGSFHVAFVPKYERMFRVRGAWTVERRPLFPGYFFVDTEDPETVETILRKVLERIAKPVCTGKDFVPIYPEEQALLESLMDAGTHTIPLSRGDFADGSFALREGPLYGRGDIVYKLDLHRRMAECRILLLGEERTMRIGLTFPQAG